ncbi:response regulator [Mycoplasmatota bacterium]|nr:response regulator [Mycoplasmatota bacterium]
MENDTSYDFSHLRVLYVEDTSAFRTLMRSIFEYLKISNYDIVDNGMEAIEYTYNKEYDLIIMDVDMPVLNGHEASSIIQKKLEVETPIYVCTTEDTDKSSILSKNDYTDLIPKPFHFTDLVRVFEKNIR